MLEDLTKRNQELLSGFVGPDSGTNLKLISHEIIDGKCFSGTLCSDEGIRYPIVEFIPRFVSGSAYTESFGYQWNLHQKTQLDSYTGLTISRDRLFESTQWESDLRGEMVLEAASGAGRFTEPLLSTGATVYSFDYSRAVDANFRNNGHAENLCLFQADIFRIPLKPASFDKVICLGALQHTSDPGGAFCSLSRMVKPGGMFVMDIYARTITAILSWKYLLRPFTKRMEREKLYNKVSRLTPPLIPYSQRLRKVLGRLGSRLLPISEYSHLGVSSELNMEWAILDTFDCYSPTHDHPARIDQVQKWFEKAGFKEIIVRYGPNGIVGCGVKI